PRLRRSARRRSPRRARGPRRGRPPRGDGGDGRRARSRPPRTRRLSWACMDAVNIALAFVLVGANGFFVATEFAIARLRPGQVDKWVSDGKPGSKSVKHAITHIDSYLAACQLGITISSLGLGALGEPAFHHLLEPIFGESATIAGIGIASALSFG